MNNKIGAIAAVVGMCAAWVFALYEICNINTDPSKKAVVSNAIASSESPIVYDDSELKKAVAEARSLLDAEKETRTSDDVLLGGSYFSSTNTTDTNYGFQDASGPDMNERVESFNQSVEETDKALEQIGELGEVEAQKGIFNVTITIPASLADDTTQADVDASVKEHGYISGQKNSDGSVTYVMSKNAHNKMLKEFRDGFTDQLKEYIDSGDYPNIEKIETNNDFTQFKVYVKDTPTLSDTFLIMGFYLTSGLYNTFAGNTIDNIHTDYINATTGEILQSADSRDLK